MNTQIINNLDHICRVCITESDDLVNLFNCTVDDLIPSVAEVLRYHAKMEISQNDGLPQSLCLTCLSFISECVKFLNKCKLSDNLLRNIQVSVINNDSQELVENNLVENTEIVQSNDTDGQVEFEYSDSLRYDDFIEEIVLNEGICESENNDQRISLNENIGDDQNFVWLEVQNNINEEANNVKEVNDVVLGTEISQEVDGIVVETYYGHVNLETDKLEEPVALDFSIPGTLSSVDPNLNNDIYVENCENEVVSEDSDIIVVSAEENIDGCEVYKIYSSDYQTYLGQYFYVGNGQIPSKSKRRNYAYYEKVLDDTSVHIEENNLNEYPDCVKIFNCKFCIKQFNTKSTLLRHMRTHTGEKPYLCADCGKQFGTLASLDLHQRVHSGEKRYECSYCERKFLDNSNLRKHLQLHTGEKPYYCDQCGRNFGRKFLLDLHMRIHTGEKPYECEICRRKFRQHGDLAAHRRIHSGDRPHKCSLCGKGFIKSSAMQLHMRSHLRSQ